MKMCISRANLFCIGLYALIGCNLPSDKPFEHITNQENIITKASSSDKDNLETIDKNYVLLVVNRNSPIEILDVTSIGKNYDFNKGIDISVRNVSEKDIVNVQIGIGPPPNCLDFYKIGDEVIDSKNEKQNTIVVTSSSNFSIHIPSDIAASYLPPKTYSSSCPRESNKPIIYVWGVEFKDNTIWKAKVQ